MIVLGLSVISIIVAAFLALAWLVLRGPDGLEGCEDQT
jgi:hypothetical protein